MHQYYVYFSEKVLLKNIKGCLPVCTPEQQLESSSKRADVHVSVGNTRQSDRYLNFDKVLPHELVTLFEWFSHTLPHTQHLVDLDGLQLSHWFPVRSLDMKMEDV